MRRSHEERETGGKKDRNISEGRMEGDPRRGWKQGRRKVRRKRYDGG